MLKRSSYGVILCILSLLVLLLGSILTHQTVKAAEGPGQIQSKMPQPLEKTFQLTGKGVAVEWASVQQRTAWSKYEPTGVYIYKNWDLKVNVSGLDESDTAILYIQSYNENDSSKAWDEWSVKLTEGEQVIQAPKSGMVYLANEADAGSITVTVRGGCQIPVFEKGKSYSKQEIQDIFAGAPNYAGAKTYVEIVGEYGFVTATYDRAEKFLKDPENLIKSIDLALQAEHEVNGYDPDANDRRHQLDPHYKHMIEDNVSSAYMHSKAHFTGYQQDSIRFLLDHDLFVKQGWGPYHENGHQMQQRLWTFYDMTEIQVNIYSLAAQKAMKQPPRLQSDDTYDKIQEYLNQPQEQKDYDTIVSRFVKLGMLHQLTLGLGDEFYPNLNRAYRDLEISDPGILQTLTNDKAKKQFFMLMACRISGKDLTPFFEQWGLEISPETKEKIQRLQLKPLQNEIWKSTDANPVCEPDVFLVGIRSNQIRINLSNELYHSGDKVEVLLNGQTQIVSFSSDEIVIGSRQKESDQSRNNIVVSDHFTTVSVLNDAYYGDFVNGYKVSTSGSDLLGQDTLLGGVRIDFSADRVKLTIDDQLRNREQRLIFLHNGSYIGESYAGSIYGFTKPNADGSIEKAYHMKGEDKIEVYAVPGKPGDSLFLSHGALLAYRVSPKYFGEVFIQVQKDHVSITMPQELYQSSQRVAIFKNKKYLGETYAGKKYYLGSYATNPGTGMCSVRLTSGQFSELSAGDVITVSAVVGAPGQSTSDIDGGKLAEAIF